jgi:uncharacterized protein (DUF924 family)
MTIMNNELLTKTHPNAIAVLEFWFADAHQPYWFAKNEAFDQLIADQFFANWQRAIVGECAHWREDHEATSAIGTTDDTGQTEPTTNPQGNIAGRLAEIIILDQFSRNLFREQPQAFAQDTLALVLAQEAVKHPDYAKLPASWQPFVIMPFMHSESTRIHDSGLPYFKSLQDGRTLEFEYKHREILDRFGRYPHRNTALGRDSTPEEIEFLQQPGSSF